MPKAILVRYRDCFNCHSCEVACQMHNGHAPGQGGVKVNAVGPWKYAPDKWEFDYVPFFTEQCDLCATRTSCSLFLNRIVCGGACGYTPRR